MSRERTPLSRRTLLRRGLAGAGAAALAPGLLTAACAPPLAAGASPSSLTVWDLFSGGDGVLMDQLIRDVSRGPDGFDVDRTILEWGFSYYTKLAMSAAGGRAPDVAVLHLSRLAAFAPAGLLDPFDLDLLAEFGLTEADFAPAVWRRARHDGALYAVPLDTHPFICFYDKEVADRAGLLDADGELVDISSPEAMLDAAAALARAQGDGGAGVLFGHVTDQAQNWRLFSALYAQTGNTIALPAGGEPEVDHDAAVRVVSFVQQLFDGRTNPRNLDYAGALAAFTTGRGAMILSGEWELPNLRSAGRPLGAAPLPTLFGTPAVSADSHAFVLPRQERVDAARRREAHRYVAAILKHSMTWATAGHIPAYQPVLARPEYARLDPQASYAAAGEIAVLPPPAWFTGAGGTFESRVSQALQTAVLGNTSAENAVRNVIDEMATMLDQPNPVV